MNVYDFDDTIYKGDSSKDFILYIALFHPIVMLKEFPRQLIALVLYLLGSISKKQMKENFFHFITELDDLEQDVKLFWNKNQYKIKEWYILQKKSDDVIISASPEFLLQEICARLDINYLIATKIDIYTGKISGENCKENEKVIRFYDRFPNGEINEFYSDSHSDRYIAAEAKKSFLVKKERIEEWIL